jgi:hypothetical protein
LIGGSTVTDGLQQSIGGSTAMDGFQRHIVAIAEAVEAWVVAMLVSLLHIKPAPWAYQTVTGQEASLTPEIRGT